MTFNEEQIQAIEWFRGPLLVLGTPGSGKTTVILQRVNRLVTVHGVIPRQILVITFTKAAARSMQQRYEAMDQASGGVRVSTFHAFFYWIIRTAYKLPAEAVLGEDERTAMIRKLLSEISPEYGNSEEVLQSVLHQMDLITNDMIRPEDYYSTDLPAEEFRLLIRRFRERKKRLGRLDFNDMLEMCYRLLTERKDILERIREMYPFIMVDEYQDTNRIQYEILKLLVHPRDNFFAVGDDDQSIYGFRGARPEIMLSFDREFPQGKRIALSVNYRCPDFITDTGARLIRHNKSRYEKALRAKKKGRPGERVIFREPANDREEHKEILSSILKAHERGVPYEEIAVLFRTNRDPRGIGFLLREYQIPYVMRDRIPDIFSHMAAEPVMDYLHFAAGEQERGRFLRIMNKPVRYIRRDLLTEDPVDLVKMTARVRGTAYLEKNLQNLREHLRRIRTLPPAAAIDYIRKVVRYEAWLMEEADRRSLDRGEILDTLDELRSMAEPYDHLEDFFEYADAYRELLKEENRKRESQREGIRPGVQLMTLHSAKGLEFREVHILDCVEDVIPHKKARTEAAVEEERRMFYVGITRASERLTIHAPKMIGRRAVHPSPFLKEIRVSGKERKDERG